MSSSTFNEKYDVSRTHVSHFKLAKSSIYLYLRISRYVYFQQGQQILKKLNVGQKAENSCDEILYFWSNEEKYLKVCIRNTGHVIATLPGSQNLR